MALHELRRQVAGLVAVSRCDKLQVIAPTERRLAMTKSLHKHTERLMLDDVTMPIVWSALAINRFSRRFRMFSVPALILLSVAGVSAADSEVAGVFKGNDQPANLMFLSVHKGTPVAGKETIKLVFTEKDHSKDEQADLKALFGHYGSALVIGIQPDGKVVTCDIAHEALKQKPISSPSSVKMSEFKNEGGQISGKLATNGKDEAFGQTWEVNLTFKTKAP